MCRSLLIANGMDASLDTSLPNYPFLASLRFSSGPSAWTPYCSGVLIDVGVPAVNGKLVLTAASCLYSRADPTSPLTIDPLKSNPYVGQTGGRALGDMTGGPTRVGSPPAGCTRTHPPARRSSSRAVPDTTMISAGKVAPFSGPATASSPTPRHVQIACICRATVRLQTVGTLTGNRQWAPQPFPCCSTIQSRTTTTLPSYYSTHSSFPTALEFFG